MISATISAMIVARVVRATTNQGQQQAGFNDQPRRCGGNAGGPGPDQQQHDGRRDRSGRSASGSAAAGGPRSDQQ
jgi:hypothetical protein